MNEFDADLRARVTTTPTGGVTVSTTGVTTSPAVLKLSIPRGASWNLYVTWTHDDVPESFVGATASFTVRQSAGGTALVSLAQSAGITLDTNYATISLTASETAALAFTQAAYQFTVVKAGVTRRLLTGLIALDKVGA